MTENIISLKDIRIFARHGCMEQEKITGNNFIVNLSVWCDFSLCAKTDKVEDTVNYVKLNEIVIQEMGISANLLESVAHRIVNRIKTDFKQIKQIEIEISKERPPIFGEIGYSSVKIIA